MKPARLSLLLFLAAVLIACGSSAAPRKIDGAWRANLLNPDSSVAFTFTTILNQGTGSTVAVSGLLFELGSSPCFTSPLGQTATFSATGHSRGFETGPFGMDVSTSFGTMVENVLTLNGTRNDDGTISGTWTLTGLSGCSGSGSYTMNLLPAL